MISPARTAALSALRQGIPSFSCQKDEDRHLAERLYYGVLQNERFLDACLALYIKSSSARMKPLLRQILRMAAYQILFLERIPASAAVNDAVMLCRQNKMEYAAGFVNAVLRNVSRDRDGLFQRNWAPPIRYSHPDWLYKRLVKDFGCSQADSFLRENQIIPGIRIQVNTLRIDFSAFLEEINTAGIRILDENRTLSSVLVPGMGVEKIPGYRKGYFFVQDDAARMAVHLCGPLNGKRVLDVCCAPGGKSMAAVLEGAESVTAFDININRLQRCRENFERMQFPIVCSEQDACVLRDELLSAYDLVIADVPCSGTGVIRKHPEIRQKTEADADCLLPVQQCILDTVSSYVKDGGILLYATCSVLKKENEDQVRQFLGTHSEFVVDPVSAEGFSCDNGMMRSWPQNNHNDGFFACRFRKRIR